MTIAYLSVLGQKEYPAESASMPVLVVIGLMFTGSKGVALLEGVWN